VTLIAANRESKNKQTPSTPLDFRTDLENHLRGCPATGPTPRAIPDNEEIRMKREESLSRVTEAPLSH